MVRSIKSSQLTPAFDLCYYAECRDLDYLLDKLQSERGKMPALNKALVELVEDSGAVRFETLAVEDKQSMLRVLRVIDKSNGYIHLPGQSLELPGLEELEGEEERWT